MYKSFILVLLLLCQPLLDSFDVAKNNDAFHLTTHLLDATQILEAHCQASDDHERHKIQHDNLSAQLSEAANDAHCHVCHLSHDLWMGALTNNIGYKSVHHHHTQHVFINAQYKVPLRPPLA
ncbi:hypothetical protein [Pseudoalteromonas sp. MMG005]|uniref:hypothetical protein n=1 Tax=Pseudoalteromonas sp. MMG005 TaxID=2822682 RepID=UPI001B39D065|nr:hypothetical protein [Pseudoalteromonas sp. MMG005]MBQ4847221.1 hypothetical protein [Pseudoalteromonas sp. MMG005]